MRGWLLSLALSLLLTLLFEGAFGLLRGLGRRGMLLLLLVNVLTNPPVVFCTLCWRQYTALPDWYLIPLLEGLAVLVEGSLYRRCPEEFSRPFLFYLCANALSYTLGLLVSALL